MAMEMKKSVCMWCHCHCKVALYIEDGRLMKVQEDPDHPVAQHFRRIIRSCPRAMSAPEWYSHPDRLTYPLKRMGNRGESKWETLSWDQAMDEVAAKLNEIRDTFGPEAIACSSGTGRTTDEFRIRFMNLLGSPNNIGMGAICYGCALVLGAALFGWPPYPPELRPETQTIFLIGNNPEQSSARFWKGILSVLNAGGKLMVLDPRRTRCAEKATVWLQNRPGTDAAVLLGMIHVIISEGLYDKAFVEKWCHGFDKLTERAEEYPPEKVAEISWVPAQQIIDAARLYAKSKPAVISNAMGIEHLENVIETLHARYILPAITGNIDIRGGEPMRGLTRKYISDFEIERNDVISREQKEKQIGSDRFKILTFLGFDLICKHSKKAWPHNLFGRSQSIFAHGPSVYRAMLTGEPYPIRAMLTLASNPMVTMANTKLVYKALKSLDLYVVHDFWMTPSAELADYVFPTASWIERPNVFNWWDGLATLDAHEAALPAKMEGKWDRRNDFDFWHELGVRIGQEKEWPWKTLEECYDDRLKPMGQNLKEFVAGGGIYKGKAEYKKYEKVGFGTPTGKAELYSVILEKLGYDPLPHYEEPHETPVSEPELAKDYPLMLITGGRHLPFYHSEHRQIESLRKQHPHPIIQLNPAKATALGINDGDWVWIETPRGRIRQKCRYFDGIDARVAHCQHGWWYPELPGEEPWLHGVWESNANVLTSDDPDRCNQISGGWPYRTNLAKIYKVKGY